MKHIIGEARPCYERYNPEIEEGIYCKCGLAVYIKQKDRKPITYIKCPNCGTVTTLYSGRLFYV